MFIGRKIQGYYSVQNASISQRRTLQMIRRSPTADERRIYVLPQHCESILLGFQLGDHRMSVTIFREITSHSGDHHSIKNYLAGVKNDLWGFIRFLEITSRYDKHNFLLKANG